MTESEFLADVSAHGSLSVGGSLGEVNMIGPEIFGNGFENPSPEKTLWERILRQADQSHPRP